MKKENESPFGNPRFLLVLAVTFLSLWGWQYYLNKKYPPATPVTAGVAPAVPAPGTVSGTTSPVTPTTATKPAELSAAEAKALSAAQSFEYADENVKFAISSLGFTFTDFQLNDYKNHEGQQIQFAQNEALYTLQYHGKAIPFQLTASEDKLVYTGIASIEGKEITRVLKYDKDLKSFVSTIVVPEGLDQLEFVVVQNQVVPKSTNFLMPSFDHQDFVYVTSGKTQSERITGIKETEIFNKTTDAVSMASVGSQYFVAAFVNKSDILPTVTKKVAAHKAIMSIEYNLKNVKVSEIKQIFYMGAKKTEILQNIDPTLPEVLNYGMFGFISKVLLMLMKLIHSFVGNWGVAIIILTIVVRTVLLPFNIMSFRSAQAMQKIKPKMDDIKVRYKADPVRMNKETMALMKENNANPLSGCLPMLLQIPIFFAFFATISTSVELYHQPFFGWIHDLSSYDPLFILPILMGVTMFFQQKLTPTTMDPLQAKILNFMPLIFTLFMVTLPSGLTLYNFISALFGVVQQYFLLKETKSQSAAVARA
jgi:YidC/Oxa1 family membrane protein insertase